MISQGGEKYQQAFYVFEELAQGTSTQSAGSLTAQAVSELHLGRYPEAETALQQALQLDPNNTDALANQVVMNTILGRDEDAQATIIKLGATQAQHPLLLDIAKRKETFDAACAKYSPKFEP